MKATMRRVLGAFRVARARAFAEGRPTLSVWADAGETALHDASRAIVASAHQNECAENDAASRVERIVADGIVDAAELAELRRIPATLRRGAERSHDITEIAAT